MNGLARVLTALLMCSVVLVPAGGHGQEVNRTAYRIGPGDVLTISVWDNKDLDRVVFVRPDGNISLALAGEIMAGGLTVGELTARLTELYRTTIKGAQVTVGVQEIRSRPVYFVSGVRQTGPLQLIQDLTLLQAISLAGGFLPEADLQSAFIVRGEIVIAVDFVRLMNEPDLTQNLRLQPGDTIVVPQAESVYVQGEVNKPGLLKYTKELTIVRAIASAGGFTEVANAKGVSVLRQNGAAKERLTVNVRDMMTDPQSAPDVPLKPNDIIIVPQRFF